MTMSLRSKDVKAIEHFPKARISQFQVSTIKHPDNNYHDITIKANIYNGERRLAIHLTLSIIKYINP